MKKTSFLFFSFLLLIGCNSKKSPIAGIWKMQEVNINGATLSFEELGTPYIEFNNKGGYLLDMSGIKEKGTYTLKDDKLTLTSSLKEKKPQELTIEKIDSLEIRYYSETDKNKMSVWLVRDRVLEHQIRKETAEKEKDEEKK